ncbi:MAG: PBP1A family penicillin-binding protein [Gemmatimonadetes bacterium]|nr:MAG: PBP1A family penicillin-binding protein [Gemmatimonadota bacterium]
MTNPSSPPTFIPWWRRPQVQRGVVIAVLSLGVFGMAFAGGAWFRACAGSRCPSIEGLGGYDPDQASKVFAADGRLITDLGLERRTVVPLGEMSPAIIAAFLSTEDKRFYRHNGIDWIRFIGAIKNNILAGSVREGFSSITMQLAGNLFPEDINRRDRSLKRKVREMRVARQIEKKYSKDKILELYLNQINLGNRAYGVEAASQRYFGKSVRNINVADAAMLAALPKAPTRYNPRRNPRRAVLRRNSIINAMRDDGLFDAAEAERWKAYPLLLSSRSDYSGVAEYFVEYVRQQLDARFGSDLYSDGYRIYTTLDLDMQQAAERALEAQLLAIEDGDYGKFTHLSYSEYLEVRSDTVAAGEEAPQYLQGLMLSIEAATGYIRAMVGGRDFEDSKFNRVTQARRQPGSTFKPFVYSAAIRAGIPLSYIMVDEPISVEMNIGEPPWEPKNFNLRYSGPMTLRRALFTSDNIIAVRLGLEEVGEQAVISEAVKFGITTPIPPYPSIFIGSADVLPIQLIGAYTTFANMGVRATPIGILRVEDRDGRILWQPEIRREVVADSAHTWLVLDVLRDVIRRGTGYRAVRAKGFDIAAGGKTGTTNDGYDVWFIGFTPDMVTGVWIGFDHPKRIMNLATGGRLAAPAWTQMMTEVYERRPAPKAWPRPSGLTFQEIDVSTGYIVTSFCPTDLRTIESYLPGTEPDQFCPVHSPFRIGGSTSSVSSPDH